MRLSDGVVDLELTLGGAPVAPSGLVLAAPVLWAEKEGPEHDAVLLSPQDYRLPSEDMSQVEAGKVPERTLTGRVELPTGPVPQGGVLTWARSNHCKPLAGSLGKGEHTVRFLCRVTDKTLVISNPVTVQGAEEAAGPEQLAVLDKGKVPAFVPKPSSPTARPGGSLDRKKLRGEIYFDSNRDGSFDIFAINADGSNVRNLTNTPDKDEFEAKVSPDGRQVAYTRGKLSNAGVWGGRWNMAPDREVWIVDRDGKNARKIADKAIRPDWGPDGKAVFYSGHVDGKGAFCAQNIRTGKVTEPLKKVKSWMRGVSGGVLAPGKLKVAFGGKLWTQLNAALYVADLNDGNYEFKSFKAVHGTYRGCTPRWSADGKRLFFAHHDPQHGGNIILWSIKPDGTGARRFETPTRKAWPGYDPFCESPDGTMVTYLDGGSAGICVMRLSDGATVRLTERKAGVQYGGLWWHRGPQGVQEQLLALGLKKAGSDTDKAVRICRTFMKDNEKNEYARMAGLEFLVSKAGEGAFDDLLAALDTSVGGSRAGVIELAAGLEGEGMTAKWIAEIDKAKPATRAGILNVLAERSDKAALPAAKKSLGDESEVVRVAAVAAVARLGGRDEVTGLVGMLEDGTPGERGAVEAELIGMKDTEAGAAIAGAIAKGGPAAKAALVRVLAERDEKPQADAVLAAASDGEESVRLAALKALGVLADEKTLPRLVGLLAGAGSDGERRAAEDAASSVCDRVKDAGKCVEPVCGAIKGASAPVHCSLLRLLRGIGGATALQAVQTSTSSADAGVKDAAVRALADWKTADATGSLMEIVRASGSTESHRLAAHQGYVRLLGLPGERTPEEGLAMYKAGLETAVRPEEKKILLAGLGRIKTIEALKVAERYFEDAAQRTAAGAAMVGIAGGIGGSHKNEAKAALKKVIGTTEDKGLKGSARNALTQIEMYEDYITAWKVAGPYTKPGKNGPALFDVAFPPESPGAKDVEWKQTPSTGDPSRAWLVDLARIVGGDNRAAYLRAVVESSEEKQVLLELGSDDGVKVWLNGKVIHANNTARGVRPAEDKVKTVLKAGENVLLVKITQGNGGWGACARFRKPDGSRLEGLKTRAE
ncbi:HEAT repeat domain-containing protein [Planctomycetota bacterium]